MKRTSIFPLTVMLLSPLAAQAVTITNTTTSTVLFSDDFESAPNVTTAPAPDLSNPADPVANVGSYFIAQPGGSALQVTNATTSPDPGPAEGINYLRDFRNFDDGSNNQGFGLVPTAAQTTAGQKIQMSMMVNVGANSAAFFGPSVTSPNGTLAGAFAYIIASSSAAGGTGFVRNYDGASSVNTSVPFVEGVWQRWDLVFTVGSNLYDLTVAGNSQTGIVGFGTGGNFAGIEFFNGSGSNGGGSFYLDAVPEPTSLTLLMLGGIGLFAAKRRQRK